MALSPPMLSCHSRPRPLSQAMSPPNAVTQGSANERPVGLPSTLNSVATQPPLSPHASPLADASPSQTFPLNPTAHGIASPVGQLASTSPVAAGLTVDGV